MNQPLVSVCITTFNHSKYINDCLMSVLLQVVCGDVEILVGDDNSTDETSILIKKIMFRFPGRIKYIWNEKNLGGCGNLKSLVRQANGRFISHLDGDDFWLPGKLHAQIGFLQSNENCSACYSNAWVVSDNLSPMGIFNNSIPVLFDLRYLMVGGNFLNHSSLMYRCDAKQIMMEMPDQFIDYKIHLALAARGMLGYVNVAYVVYRHGSSQSMIQNSNDKVRFLYLMALLDIFEREKVSRAVRSVALGDFWARVIKDAIYKSKFSWWLYWCREFKIHCVDDGRKAMVLGFFKSVPMLCSSVYRCFLSRLIPGDEIRIFNRR